MGDDRLNYIVSLFVPFGLNVKAESATAEHICREMRGLERLRGCVRRVEESLVHTLGLSERSSDLKSASDRGKSVGCKLDGSRATRNISAALCHSASGVLDQRADDHISSDRRRLASLGKLTVAVVDHDVSTRADGADELDYLTDIVNAQSLSVEISLGALNEDDLYSLSVLCYHLCYSVKVKASVVLQIRLSVVNSEIAERAIARLADVSDDLVKRVVGLACDREHNVTRAQKSEKTDSERLSAVDDIVAHERRLSTHNVSPDRVKHLASAIVVAVSTARHKHSLADSVLAEGIHYLFCIFKRDRIDLAKNRGKLSLCFCAERENFF